MSDGKPTSHLKAFEALLSKRWTRQEVEQAHARGFFRRLLPQLGVDRLQASAALLLAACARLHPPLLLPLTQVLCSGLPALICSPSQDVRQAGLCLLGLTWRAAIASGPSQLATQILEAPKLLASLCARLAAGDFDALWAVREVAADPRGAAALERCGALRCVCQALRRIVAAAKNAAGGDDSGGDGSADGSADGSGGEEAREKRRTVMGKPGPGAGGARRVASAQQQWQQPPQQRVRRSAGAPPPPLASKGGLKAGVPAPAPAGADAGAGSPVGRLGVTEGGGEVERAAEGILVADCLAALTSLLSATVLMCKRYRVPERLVALLLRTAPVETEEDDDHDDDHEAAVAVAGVGSGAGPGSETGKGLGDGPGSESGKGFGNGPGAAKVPRLALPGSQPSKAAAAATGTAHGSKGEVDGEGTKEKSSRGSSTGSSSGSSITGSSSSSSSGSGNSSRGSSRSGAGGGRGGGSNAGRSKSAGTGGGSGGGGADNGGGEAEGDHEEAAGEEQGTRRPWGAVQRSRLQLQEALLRCLYALASCGQGQEPQKAVQEALRDAGDPAMQRLALVLKERRRMEGCNAAAYLLWLCASGDFSSFEGSELNVLRSRMGAEAPPPPRPGSGGGGGDSGERNSGLGIVPMVSELLLRHLASWRNVELVDCVPAVRTTVPPPPPPPPPAAAATASAGALDGAAAADAFGGGGGGSRVASAFGTKLAGGGGGGAGSGFGNSHHPVVAAHANSLRGRSGSDGVPRIGSTTVSIPQAPPPDGTAPDGDETIPRGPLQLRVMGSTGVLLTPRDGKAGQASTVSPQRYSSDSSDEGFAGGGSGSGSGGGGEGGSAAGRPDASGGTADPLGNTHELDLIDSSVELTGKEQIMQMIKDAGAALLDGRSLVAQPEDLTVRQDASRVLPPDDAASAAESPSWVAEGDGVDRAVYGSGGPPSPEAGVASPPSAASDGAPGTGSSPDGAPDDHSPPPTEPPGPLDVACDVVAGSSAMPYVVRRPPALALPFALPSPRRRQPQILPSTVTWLGVVRHARGGGPYSRRGRVPPPSEVQELLSSCAGLLSAVALSAAGCRAICSTVELLPYLASLLDLPMDLPDSTEAAALNDSCLNLRLQLLALLTNLSMHPEGAAAIAAAAAAGSSQLGTPQGAAATLVEILYGTASLSCEMISSSPTSWSTGLRLLEPCFTIMANIHRCPSVQLSVPPDPSSNKPRDSFCLAVRALSMALPASMGLADRTRLRAAAARMLDSAVAAYEGVGRDVPPATVPELLLLLTGGRPVPAVAGAEERGGGSGGAGGAASAAAAAAAAGALWQLLSGGIVHPEVAAGPLQGPLVAILRNQREGDPELRRLALGLVSCLARSPLVARRLWTSPLVSAVLRAHALAVEWGRKDEGSWQPVEETARVVCQQLCRACHREDRGAVSDTDKRVDKWGMAERMLTQLKSKLEFDYDEEAIMLVPMEE